MLLVSCQGHQAIRSTASWQRRYEASHTKQDMFSNIFQKGLTQQQRLLRGVAWLIRSRGLVQVLRSQPQTPASPRSFFTFYMLHEASLLHVKPEASFWTQEPHNPCHTV
jgi:hypothetical protein